MKNIGIVLSAILNKDVTSEVATLAAARTALGNALALDQQLFVSGQWRNIDAWLASDNGREAARAAVNEWITWVKEANSL